ncbi:GNAT family N-acetyltransferase [Acetatifactor muris]|uniref:GNAT family N-acetyltransferase n=1 Tax=Acetatifactor muris TaxID=879566 RepID=UPI0023F50F01|nr:GNAT family N-acetyltransferase [Acetatifactor muris]
MVSIKEINYTNRDYIKPIAELHMRAFPTFFLTQLGLSFLKTLYAGYLEDEDSGIIIAVEKGKLIGFIAYSKDYPQFYKGLIRHHLFRFGVCSIGAVICHPSFIKRLLGAFKKSDSVVKEEKYVELASICVNPGTESRGVGTSLIDYLKRKVDFNEYSYINLETDAEGNDGVNKFYLKNEFRLTRQFITAEGRRMNEYRYKKEGL